MTESLRVLVVGFGSIGQRHARLLVEAGADVKIVSRRGETSFPTWTVLGEALDATGPDLVVVATETSDHARQLRALDEYGYDGLVLVEKPLCQIGSDYKPVNANIFVGYNLRQFEALRRLREMVQGDTIVSAEVTCASYLPDWRPERDYRSTASASKEKAGGVLHDLSHELDYVNWILGPWQALCAVAGKFSTLEINSIDTAVILVRTDRCPAASITLSYAQRIAARRITVNTTSCTLHVDLETGALMQDGKVILAPSAMDIDQTYRDQLHAILSGDRSRLCDLESALLTQSMLAAVATAADCNRWEKR